MSYDALRKANIARNEAFLESIGIDSKGSTLPNKREKQRQSGKNFSKKRQNKAGSEEMREGTRKSSRLDKDKKDEVFLELGRDGIVDVDRPRTVQVREQKKYVVGELGEYWDFDTESLSARQCAVKPKNLLAYIEGVNKRHYDGISGQQVSHCCMRLNSMTTKAFANRVKQIARHAGQHSYEKLLIAYYAVKFAGMNELHDACKQALTNIGVDVSESTE